MKDVPNFRTGSNTGLTKLNREKKCPNLLSATFFLYKTSNPSAKYWYSVQIVQGFFWPKYPAIASPSEKYVFFAPILNENSPSSVVILLSSDGAMIYRGAPRFYFRCLLRYFCSIRCPQFNYRHRKMTLE